MTDQELIQSTMAHVETLVARFLEQGQAIRSQREEIAALRAFMRPSSVPLVADVPFREVTKVEVEEEPE